MRDYVLGACIALGLIIGGSMIPKAVSKYRSYERTVEVKGLCEREVPADKVIWPLQYKVVGNELNPLLVQVDNSNNAIKKFLMEGGIAEDEISVSTPSIDDRDAAEYTNQRPNRYVVKSTLTVCTKNVDAVLALMREQASLLKHGIVFQQDYYYGGGAQFIFEGLNAVKPEMIEEATASARMAAKKFAEDSDSELGKIKTATQGTFSISDRDSNTPQVKQVRVVTYVTYYLKD